VTLRRVASVVRLLALTGLGAASGFVLSTNVWGAGLGLTAGFACDVWLSQQPSAAERADRWRFDADLPFAVDLMSAALRAGAAPDAAARVVAEAVGGPVGERLGRVERALRLGLSSREAWAYLGRSDGAVRVARAADRSTHSGAAFASSLARVAEDLRTDGLHAAEARARTAGVLIVLPLGLCFLPAFVLTGLVPVIVAVVGGVLTTKP
jgi:pilus assembly protein TadC